MRRVILLVIFILIAGLSVSYASEKVFLDNQYIQQYKGQNGLWVNVKSKGQIYFYAKKFGASLNDIYRINGTNITLGEHIFVPYSKEYLEALLKEGKIRISVVSTKNEFIWPLSVVNQISSTFGRRGRKFHTGADMPATKGTPIVAAMDGRVISCRYDGGFGRTIIIEHRDNFFTRYAHNSVILVKVGDCVKKGQVIAMVGCTGNSTGNHLHFEIRYNEIPLNPLDFLPYKEHLKEAHLMRTWK